MLAKLRRRAGVLNLLLVLGCATIFGAHGVSARSAASHGAPVRLAQTQAEHEAASPPVGPESGANGTGDLNGASGGDAASSGAHGQKEEPGTFDPHAGTWVNPIARAFTGESAPKFEVHDGEKHVENIRSIRYDYLVIALGIMAVLCLVGVTAARKARIRPNGKPHSMTNMVEAAVEGFREYLIGIMGRDMAIKYAPLISSFFFTILLMNWIGLVPGMLAPTSNPNVPIALALVAFLCVHIIAIKEAGVKSWFMHFVGEPKWLAFLNFPLHIIGELIKPLSLAMRLLCNVFGEEMVVVKLTGLAVLSLPLWLPIPFQLPMLFLGSFFGLLQALVFSTLLAIYISILSTHEDDHGGHGHVEHVREGGREQIVAHPTQSPVG